MEGTRRHEILTLSLPGQWDTNVGRENTTQNVDEEEFKEEPGTGIPDGPIYLRLYHLFIFMLEPHKKLQVYKQTSLQLLNFCEPYARYSLDYTADDWDVRSPHNAYLQVAFLWYLKCSRDLRRWSSWPILALLVAWKSIRDELASLRRTIPKHVLDKYEMERKANGSPSDIFAEFDDAGETIPALKLVLSSKEELKSVMRLRERDAQSFIDLLDKVLGTIDPTSRLHMQCFHAQRKLCGRASVLPTAFDLSEHLEKKSSEPVGSGGFADVWLGTLKERPVALKVLRIYGRSNLDKVKTAFCREAVLWKRLAHQNIVPFLGISTEKLFPLCMICEWMENGNVTTYLKTNLRANRLDLLVDIVTGLQYLHTINVLHGDLKGANILIDATFHARLSDFGLTAVTYDPNTVNAITTSSAVDGSIRWMAPEFFSAGDTRVRFSPESDMYALAMVVYEIFTGRVPFYDYPLDANVVFIVIMGVRPVRPVHGAVLGLSDELWATVEACWQAERTARPTVSAVLRHVEAARTAYTVPKESGWAPALAELRAAEDRVRANDDSDDEDEDGAVLPMPGYVAPAIRQAEAQEPAPFQSVVDNDQLAAAMRRMELARDEDGERERTPRPAPALWEGIANDDAWY